MAGVGLMVADSRIAQQVIQLCDQAVVANLGTPGRHGTLIELSGDDADDILVSADLHGHRLNFLGICRHADLENHPRRHLLVQEVCHGGPKYPGVSGCMSHLLLEDVARLITEFPGRVHFLLGNHELAEITDFPISKGACMLNLQFRLGIDKFYGESATEVRQAYQRFLLSCPLAVRLNRQVLISHSLPERVDVEGFDPQVLEQDLRQVDLSPQGPVFPLLWGRDFRQENADAFARAMQVDFLIHGHVPCSEGYAVPNERQMILDCSRQPAKYLLLPLDGPLDRQLILQSMRDLEN
jgi:hypothetical protein